MPLSRPLFSSINLTPPQPQGLLTAKTIAANNFYDLVAVTNSDQQLTSFDKPLTFTITYGSDTTANYIESSLDVYKYDGTNWIKKNCTLNTTAHTLTCSLTGFSVYGVLGQPLTSNSDNTSSSTSVSTTTSSASTCGDALPASTPDLFQIDTSTTSAKLLFTPISNTNNFYISFSEKPECRSLWHR